MIIRQSLSRWTCPVTVFNWTTKYYLFCFQVLPLLGKTVFCWTNALRFFFISSCSFKNVPGFFHTQIFSYILVFVTIFSEMKWKNCKTLELQQFFRIFSCMFLKTCVVFWHGQHLFEHFGACGHLPWLKWKQNFKALSFCCFSRSLHFLQQKHFLTRATCVFWFRCGHLPWSQVEKTCKRQESFFCSWEVESWILPWGKV